MQDYPEQLDCVWLAVDSDGHVGVFITAGIGPISEAILGQQFPICEIESELTKLPEIAEVNLMADFPFSDSFMELAKRGLFVYDWQNAHRRRSEVKLGYDLVAAPTYPIKIKEIPSGLINLAMTSALRKHIFSKDKLINVESEFPCLSGAE